MSFLTILIAAALGAISGMIIKAPKFLMSLISKNLHNSVTVFSFNKLLYDSVDNWIKKTFNEVCYNHIMYDILADINGSIGYGSYFFKYNKCFVYIKKERVDIPNWSGIINQLTMSFYGQGKKQLYNECLDTIKIALNINKQKVYINEWDYKYIPKVTFDNVYFRYKNDLIKELSKWYQSSTDFHDRGELHKLGIFLTGEPGVGKSILSRAIADYVGYDINIIDFKSFDTERSFIERVSKIKPYSVILMEDIDIAYKKRDEKNKNKISFATILNVLDGIHSPDGVIFIATSNLKPSVFDKALLRSGRFDLVYELDKIQNKEEIIEYFNCKGKIIENYTNKIEFPVSQSDLRKLL